MNTLSIIPFLKPCGNYTNIITINAIPNGPLKNFVRRLTYPKLSPFQSFPKCLLGLVFPFTDESRIVEANDIPYLFEFLNSNGYIIDSRVTDMMNNSSIRLTNETILCFIRYS
jgi:hypothetical protein